jgi:hypothetical protein
VAILAAPLFHGPGLILQDGKAALNEVAYLNGTCSNN